MSISQPTHNKVSDLVCMCVSALLWIFSSVIKDQLVLFRAMQTPHD